MEPSAEASALEVALTALDMRHASPQAAYDLASDLLTTRSEADEARVVALWASAVALRELNDLGGSEERLESAIELGERLGLTDRVDGARAARSSTC